MTDDRDELLRLAFEYVNAYQPNDEIERAFKSIARAPLAVLVSRFLEATPKIDIAPLLLSIAELNQGRLEDLDSPAFLSYLVARLKTNEAELRRIRSMLGTFQQMRMVKETAPDKTLLIAARDDDPNGSRRVTLSDLLEQQKKRKK
jgi:hypothetical protein